MEFSEVDNLLLNLASGLDVKALHKSEIDLLLKERPQEFLACVDAEIEKKNAEVIILAEYKRIVEKEQIMIKAVMYRMNDDLVPIKIRESEAFENKDEAIKKLSTNPDWNGVPDYSLEWEVVDESNV